MDFELFVKIFNYIGEITTIIGLLIKLIYNYIKFSKTIKSAVQNSSRITEKSVICVDGVNNQVTIYYNSDNNHTP